MQWYNINKRNGKRILRHGFDAIMCLIFIILCNLYSSHAIVAKTDQCRWEILNGSSTMVSTTTSTSNGSTTNIHNQYQLHQHEQRLQHNNHYHHHHQQQQYQSNALLFKFICNINSLNDSNYIVQAGASAYTAGVGSSVATANSNEKRDLSKVQHLVLSCTSPVPGAVASSGTTGTVHTVNKKNHKEQVLNFFNNVATSSNTRIAVGDANSNNVVVESSASAGSSSVNIYTDDEEVSIDRVGEQLPSLERLNVEYCRLRRLPDKMFGRFGRLHALTIRNYVVDGPNLELFSTSFWGLAELSELDLSWNNVWSLPSDTFCALPKLSQLNLSHNSLTELTQLEFSQPAPTPQSPLSPLPSPPTPPASPAFGRGNSDNDMPVAVAATGAACAYPKLEVLDVSYNRVNVVAAADFSLLRNLKVLLLNHNHLNELSDGAFRGLVELTYVDLTNNRLVALPHALFRHNRKLVKLVVRNNSLAALTPAVFEGLETSLEVLDLSHNSLTSTWINGFIFARLTNLVALNLAHNVLIKIDEFLFYDFKNLQILDLSGNQIDEINEKAFINLYNLKVLNLAFNKLRILDKPFFGQVSALTQLSLESNLISSIHSEFFRNLLSLQDLNLSGNLLIELPSGLSRLLALKWLDVGKNNIHFIDGTKFDGLVNLLGLRMVDNFITNLTSASLRQLPNLHVLNLASNRLRFVERTTFDANIKLNAIRFDNNQIEDISSTFQSLKSLVWLNLSDNKIKEFDYNYIPAQLEWLDLHKNAIIELSDYEMQKNNLRLSYLDVSMNQITYLNDLSVPDNVAEINLNANQISDVHAGTLLKKNRLKRVELKGNLIRKLNRDALRIYKNDERVGSSSPSTAPVPHVFLSENPLVCDCHTEWLKEVNRLKGYPVIADIRDIDCVVELFRHSNQTRPLHQVSRDAFLCRYESHCLSSCHCCEFDACDCEYVCPRRCDCFYDETWRINVVDCGRADYFEIPRNIPMDATQIYLDGNDIGSLNEHIFLGKKKLEILYLNGSQIVSVHNRTFAGVGSIQKLHLENNFIQTINEIMFEELENLIEIFLNGNSIESVPVLTFKSHKHLKLINLAYNRLKSLEFFHHLPASVALSSTYFKNNPWTCNECLVTDNLRVIRLLHKLCPMNKCNYRRVSLSSSIAAAAAAGASASGTTSSGGVEQDERELIKREYVQTLAAIIVSIIGTMFLLSLVCVFRSNVSLWFFTRYHYRWQRDPTTLLDLNRNYDATIVFNNRDSDFVYRILSLQLENRSFKIFHQDSILQPSCTNSSDDPGDDCAAYDSIQNDVKDMGDDSQVKITGGGACGTTTISSASKVAMSFSYELFVQNVEISKRLILLLSANFLNGEWRHIDFRIALQNYLNKMDPSLRPYRIILVIAVPLELLLIDPVLESLAKSCTRVIWGEKQFWEKLLYAMPDPDRYRMMGKIPLPMSLSLATSTKDLHAPVLVGAIPNPSSMVTLKVTGRAQGQNRVFDYHKQPAAQYLREQNLEDADDDFKIDNTNGLDINSPNDEEVDDNLSSSNISRPNKFDTQTYINKSTGHIYTTIAPLLPTTALSSSPSKHPSSSSPTSHQQQHQQSSPQLSKHLQHSPLLSYPHSQRQSPVKTPSPTVVSIGKRVTTPTALMNGGDNITFIHNTVGVGKNNNTKKKRHGVANPGLEQEQGQEKHEISKSQLSINGSGVDYHLPHPSPFSYKEGVANGMIIGAPMNGNGKAYFV